MMDQTDNHDPGHPKTIPLTNERMGTSYEAVLAPSSGQYLGSQPNKTAFPRALAYLDNNFPTANRWIRGHLLNDWLGGHGIVDNLTLMSHTTNQRWNGAFEQPMKRLVEKLGSIYSGAGSRYKPIYLVYVGYQAEISQDVHDDFDNQMPVPKYIRGYNYFAARNRTNGTIYFDDNTVETALDELDQVAYRGRQTIEGLADGCHQSEVEQVY